MPGTEKGHYDPLFLLAKMEAFELIPAPQVLPVKFLHHTTGKQWSNCPFTVKLFNL
jgi:hypothetical protein